MRRGAEDGLGEAPAAGEPLPSRGSEADGAAGPPAGPAGDFSGPATAAAAGTSRDAATAALILQTWLSPAFPVGAFAYSHGLEWAVEDGSVGDLTSLVAWLDGVVRFGAGRSDAILLAHAWRAVRAGAWTSDRPEDTPANYLAEPPDQPLDDGSLAGVAALAEALQPTRERRLEALSQGEAFLKAVRATWPHPAIETAAEAFATAGIRPAYPVAVGIAAAAHGLPLELTAAAFVQAFAANLASAAVRLVPLGQTDGQRAIAALTTTFAVVAAEAVAAPLAAVGGATLRADIASARHETQYTRLFRS